MNDRGLPRSWTEATIGDLVDRLQYGLTAKAIASRQGPRFLRITDLDSGRVDWSTVPGCDLSKADLDKYRLIADDIVFARTGSIEKAARIVNPPDAVFASYLIRGRPVVREIAGWLGLFVGSYSYVNQAKKLSAGIGRANVNAHNLAKVRIALAPVFEQQRIVEIVDSYLTRLDAAVVSLERIQAKLKAYRASVLKAAVEGRLVPTEASLARAEKRTYESAGALLARILKERRCSWQERELARLKAAGKTPKDDRWKTKYEEPAGPATARLPDLPEGWCWATLPQLGELNRGKSKHRPRNDPRLLGGKYPFVQTGDIRKAETWLRTFEDTYSDFGLAQSRLWPAGTLCITIAANIAETAILGFDGCFPDSVVGFLQNELVLTRYLEMFLRTARQRLDQYAPSTAQKNINLDTLSKVAVPLPPLNEQRRMVEELDRLFSVATTIGDGLSADQKRCARLRQAVLKWAFEGKLVDQDPTNEPAERLLARIRSDRAVAGRAANGRVRKSKGPA